MRNVFSWVRTEWLTSGVVLWAWSVAKYWYAMGDRLIHLVSQRDETIQESQAFKQGLFTFTLLLIVLVLVISMLRSQPLGWRVFNILTCGFTLIVWVLFMMFHAAAPGLIG